LVVYYSGWVGEEGGGTTRILKPDTATEEFIYLFFIVFIVFPKSITKQPVFHLVNGKEEEAT
jgi:hypothetical protein